MTPKRTTVVFDLGGVLVDWNPRYLYRTLFAENESEMERFLAEVCTNAWNLEQDRGRAWSEAIADLSERHPDDAPLIEAFRSRWSEMLKGPIDDSVTILSELKNAGTPLYALTNWSHETFPIALERFPFLSWFDGIVVSGTERLVKPDPRIFSLMMERYELRADELIFIDDNRGNAEAAAAIGWHGIHFITPAALRAELAALGFPLTVED